MGGHHIEPPKVPDYRIYKVEDCPQLVRTQQMLAQKGLKDPWLRNEVWRYPPSTQRSAISALYPILFHGLKYGIAAFVLTVVGEKIYHHYYPAEDPHHHH